MVNAAGTVRTPHTASPYISQCTRTVWVDVGFNAVYNARIKHIHTHFSYPDPQSHEAIGWGAETLCLADQCCAFYIHK